MKKNSIDEYKVFEISQNYSVNVETYKKYDVKVVVVDDFYANPEMVRQLALDIPASQNKRIRGGNLSLIHI